MGRKGLFGRAISAESQGRRVGTGAASTLDMLSDSHRNEHRFAQKTHRGLVISRLEYTNAVTVRRDEVIAPWHEIIVNVGGECLVGRGRGPAKILGRSVVVVNPGERYSEEHFAAGGEVGTLVVIGIRDLDALGTPDVVFGLDPIEDESFVDAIRNLVLAERAGQNLDEETVALLVRKLVAERGQAIPSDRLFAVKREIDKNPHAPLYVAQLAEMASMHPETFTRAFARRFGVTPIRYRLHRRLLEAAYLLLTEPHLLVSDVATRVGFEDLRFFHRSFRSRSGVSPAAYRQWFAEGALGRRRASGIPPKQSGRPGSGEAAA